MAIVTTPSGQTFEETSPTALSYYEREEGYTVGEAVPEEAAELVDATVAQVLAEVGDDPQLAALALAAEQARDRPRVSLVEKLTVLAAAGSEPPVED